MPIEPLPGTDVVAAGFLRRWAAFFLDSLILTSAFQALAFVVVLVMAGAGGLESLQGDELPPALVIAYAALVVAYFVMAGLYFALLESSRHQASVGKMALGIKVTDIHGARLGFAHALGRWAAAALSYLTLYIGFLMAAFTQRKVTLHDLVARAQVVDRWAYTDQPERQQRGLNGCLIAFLVAIVLMGGLAVVGILAAIAIPAYADYTQRAQVASALAGAAPARLALAEAMLQGGACPDNDADGLQAPEAYASTEISRLEAGELADGRCGLRLQLTPAVHGSEDEAWIALAFDPDSGRWSCGSGLPDRKLPASCRQ